MSKGSNLVCDVDDDDAAAAAAVLEGGSVSMFMFTFA